MVKKSFFQIGIFLILLLSLPGCSKDDDNENNKVKHLLTLVEQVPQQSPNYKTLADSIYNLSSATNYKAGIGKSLFLQGNFYYKNQNYKEALNKYLAAVKVDKNNNDLKQLADDYDNLALAYNRLKRRDKAVESLKASAKIKKEAKDSTGLGVSLNNIGFIFWQTTQYDSAIIYFEKALEIRKKIPNKEHLASTLNNIGTIYYRWANYDKALFYYLQALKIQKEINNNSGASLALTNIGLIYKETSQISKAINYYRESIPFAITSSDSEAIGYVYNCLGLAFVDLNRDSSEFYFKKSLAAYDAIKYVPGQILALKGIGELYAKYGNKSEAENYFLKILKLARHENIQLRIAQAYKYLGELEYQNSSLLKAKDYISKSIEVGERLNLKKILRDDYKNLSDIFEKLGNVNQALASIRKYEFYRQQIEDEDMARRLSDLKSKFEHDRYQLNLQAQQYENEKQRIFLLFTIAAVLFLSIVSLIFYRMSAKRKKINRLLIQKNNLIAGQTAELQDKNRELQELNDSKDKFFSIIAHDLKNPFNALLNYSMFLKEDYDEITDETKKEYIENIVNTTHETYELLENLLHLSASKTGKINIAPEEIKISRVVNKVIGLFNLQTFNKNIIVNNKLPESAIVYADADMLEIVIRNLLNNAVKFSNKGGSIEIYSEKISDKICVYMKDEGVGMDENTLKNIFNINVIRSKKGTAGEKGTGFGLGLCKEFIEKNNGEIFVESKLGKGSTFYFCLPYNNSSN